MFTLDKAELHEHKARLFVCFVRNKDCLRPRYFSLSYFMAAVRLARRTRVALRTSSPAATAPTLVPVQRLQAWEPPTFVSTQTKQQSRCAVTHSPTTTAATTPSSTPTRSNGAATASSPRTRLTSGRRICARMCRSSVWGSRGFIVESVVRTMRLSSSWMNSAVRCLDAGMYWS